MSKELIDLIDRARWKEGSYKAVAEKMGITAGRLSDFKHGNRTPSTLNICQLADIAGLDVAETLFKILEKLDTEHAELYRIWRPYGDSNPGYRRERASALSLFFIVKFCNLALMMAKHLSIRVGFQVLNVHSVVLCVCLNAPIIAKRDKSGHLALSKS